MPYYISPPPQNPLARMLALIIAVFAMAGAFMIGMVAFMVVAGVGLISGLAIWLRVAWIKRKLGKSNTHPQQPTASGEVLEAEYTVVSERDGDE